MDFEFASREGNSAVGLRVSHFAKMLGKAARNDRLVMSFHTGLRQNLAVALRAKLTGRRVIREINEWPLSVIWGESRLKQWAEVHVLPKLFDGFVCISDVLVGFCREHGRPGVPILKVPMTVDVGAVDAVPPAAKGASSRRVVYVGGRTEAKDGVGTLERAMATVGAELVLVSGKTHDEAVAIMKSADCLVLARPDSLQARAGFPTKLGEYLATGLPVVVTKTGEIPKFLTDGVDAFLVEPGDADRLGERIRHVLSHPQEAAAVGAAGRQAALRHFDWHNHAKALNEWLTQFM